MRVDVLVPARLPALTGGSIYNRALIRELSRRGHTVAVHPVPVRPAVRLWLENARPRAVRLLSPPEGDLVIVDGLLHPGLLLPHRFPAIRRRGARVALLHQLSPPPPDGQAARRLAEAVFLGSVDALLCPGRLLAAEAARRTRGGLPVHAAPPGGDRLGGAEDEAAIRRRSAAPGPLALLFVGNLSPVKGLLPLLAALAGLPAALWRLLVVGSPALDPETFRRARREVLRLGLGERVRFAGPRDGDALARCYAEAHAFAMPFARESFGIAALEAMAFGLPVIGSAASGVREFVRHGENGWLIPPGDLAACRRAVRELALNRERLAELGVRAWRDFRRQPTWRESLAGACRFLEACARRGGQARALRGLAPPHGALP